MSGSFPQVYVVQDCCLVEKVHTCLILWFISEMYSFLIINLPAAYTEQSVLQSSLFLMLLFHSSSKQFVHYDIQRL